MLIDNFVATAIQRNGIILNETHAAHCCGKLLISFANHERKWLHRIEIWDACSWAQFTISQLHVPLCSTDSAEFSICPSNLRNWKFVVNLSVKASDKQKPAHINFPTIMTVIHGDERKRNHVLIIPIWKRFWLKFREFSETVCSPLALRFDVSVWWITN